VLAASVRLATRIGAAERNAARAAAVAPTQAFATDAATTQTDSAPAPASGQRPVVLVAEDDEFLHTLIAAMLAEQVELVFETDGAAALARIEAVCPDLVLMDVVLPGGDGVMLTEEIKSTPGLSTIPVVMLTGEARVDTLVRSVHAGAADFIVKPFTREALVAKLGKYLPALV
jgi:CheY-like chemotaxis protein